LKPFFCDTAWFVSFLVLWWKNGYISSKNLPKPKDVVPSAIVTAFTAFKVPKWLQKTAMTLFSLVTVVLFFIIQFWAPSHFIKSELDVLQSVIIDLVFSLFISSALQGTTIIESKLIYSYLQKISHLIP